MDNDQFRAFAHRAADWGADYRAGLADRKVRPDLKPGEIGAQLPGSPPEAAEAMDAIFADFDKIIVPGMTHWQSPNFFAYFPANAAPPSVLAEMLVASIGAQCMLWQTSPAATELEITVVDWLRQAVGLPEGFSGVLADSASSATLAAVLTMRERALKFAGNRDGLAAHSRLRVYASGECHSSIDKAVWVAGIGTDNLVKIPAVGPQRSMDVAALDAAIIADKAAGYLPIGVVACVGGTSVGGTDKVAEVAAVVRKHDLFLHVDAAWAGAAMICPEYRHFWDGAGEADSIVLNPHKWLGAQFDCSAHFIRDPATLVQTLAARPEYLKTGGTGPVVNFSEWSVPLGRPFRALKLWFLIRAHGLEGLRAMIRRHVAWAEMACKAIAALPDFRIVTPPMLSLFSFRHEPAGIADLDGHNLALVDAINRDGRIYLTQTRVDGKVAIRFVVGSFATEEDNVSRAVEVIAEIAGRM